jgi:hypothetical protein
VAVATSIAPTALLEAPPEIFWAIVDVLVEQNREMEKQQRKARR